MQISYGDGGPFFIYKYSQCLFFLSPRSAVGYVAGIRLVSYSVGILDVLSRTMQHGMGATLFTALVGTFSNHFRWLKAKPG